MSQVFVLQNQDGYFLSKQKEWLDGRDAPVLFRCAHYDEALNQMVEINSKDYTQRITIVECQLNDKRHPMLDPDTLAAANTESPNKAQPIEAPSHTDTDVNQAEAALVATANTEVDRDPGLLDFPPEDNP